MSILFMMSILGLASIVGLSFFGKYGNFLRKEGFVGTISRGMAGAFTFFIVLVILIWTIGALLLFGIIAAIATFCGWKFKGKNVFWNFKTQQTSDETMWPYEKTENKVITLKPTEWDEPEAPKKPRRSRKKKEPPETQTPPES